MTVEAGTEAGNFVDRSRRLVFFGIVAVGLGLLAAGIGLLQVALTFLGSLVPEASGLATDPASVFMGATLYGLIGAAFVWVGVGSILKRRWARPLMLTLAWTWLAGGVLATLVTPRLMDSLALAAPDEMGMGGVLGAVKLSVLLVLAGGGIVLPAIFVWVYRDEHVLRTCQAHDSRPCWTERCPTQVLGLSVGLGACALLVLPMLARPAVPFFTVVLTGWKAVLVLIAGALACAYLARSTFRLEMSGWWGTVLLLMLLGLATGIAFAMIEPGEMYRALGYPDTQVRALEKSGIASAWLGVGFSAALTLASLGYMAGIRKHFTRGGAASGRTAPR